MPDTDINTAWEVRVFLSKLEKGDTFMLGKKKIEVVSKAKDLSLRLNIDGKTKKLHYKYGDWYGTMGRGADWFDNYFRDIDGYITIDLINRNNPFHEISIFSKHISPDVFTTPYLFKKW